MAYPRSCEGCGVQYTDFARQGNFVHVTLTAEDGGTSSPWAPDKPGRVMDIGCKLCGAIFRWDYFGRSEDGRLGQPLAIVRTPVENWRRDAVDEPTQPWAGVR